MTEFNDNQFFPYPHMVPHIAPAPHSPFWEKDAVYHLPIVSPVGNGPKGEKGDPGKDGKDMTFKDLTPEELEYLANRVASARNISLEEVVTVGGGVTRIPIPFDDYSPTDILFVDINGLDLAEGVDYTIDGTDIVLTNPITENGSEVHFKLLRYETPEGTKYILDQSVLDALEQMRALRNEMDGMVYNEDDNLVIEVMNGESTLTLVHTKTNFICIDCASDNDSQRIRSFLSEKLGSKKLDALIITHYHEDHYLGIDSVLNFCDANTKIYEQMLINTSTCDEASSYTTGRTIVRDACAAKSFGYPVVPAENSTVKFGDMKVKFHNVAYATYGSYYDNAYGQDQSAPQYNEPRSTLNNYSMVVEISAYENTYIDLADIEGEAQKQMYGILSKATVAKYPHHFWNRMGYQKLFDTINPDAWIVTDQLRHVGTPITKQEFQETYLFRYLLYNRINTPIVTNGQMTDVKIVCHSNQVISKEGYILSWDYDPDQQEGQPISTGYKAILWDAVLPPYIYFDNPYAARLLTADDLSMLKKMHSLLPSYDFYVPYNETYQNRFLIRPDLEQILSPQPTSSSIIYINFHDTKGVAVFLEKSATLNKQAVYLAEEFKMEKIPFHMQVENSAVFPFEIKPHSGDSWSNNDNVSQNFDVYANGELVQFTDDTRKQEALSHLIRANMLVAECAGLVPTIPLTNIRNLLSSGDVRGSFTGTTMYDGVIYTINFNENYVLNLIGYTLSNNSAAAFNVTSIHVAME